MLTMMNLDHGDNVDHVGHVYSRDLVDCRLTKKNNLFSKKGNFSKRWKDHIESQVTSNQYDKNH